MEASLARLEGRDDPTSWVAFRRASRGSAMKLQVLLVLVAAAASLTAAQESDGEAGCRWVALGRRLLPPTPQDSGGKSPGGGPGPVSQACNRASLQGDTAAPAASGPIRPRPRLTSPFTYPLLPAADLLLSLPNACAENWDNATAGLAGAAWVAGTPPCGGGTVQPWFGVTCNEQGQVVKL